VSVVAVAPTKDVLDERLGARKKRRWVGHAAYKHEDVRRQVRVGNDAAGRGGALVGSGRPFVLRVVHGVPDGGKRRIVTGQAKSLHANPGIQRGGGGRSLELAEDEVGRL
jgi:hypothetical protein